MSGRLRTFGVAVCWLWAVGAFGFDAYLKIAGVEGESTDSHHLNWIEVQSFSQGTARSARADFSDLCLSKALDRSSPLLSQGCAKGTHFPSATLELITSDANRVRFYQLTLSNVVVTSQTVSAAGAERPAEALCLGYSWIGWKYTEVDTRGVPVGDLGSWWDIAANMGATDGASTFTVSATQVDPGNLLLSWPGQSNRTYNVLASPTVTGSYELLQSVTASGDGPVSLRLPISGGAKFFQVQQGP